MSLEESERHSLHAIPPLPTLRAERYRGFKPVGAGGMGIVFSVEDRYLQREVAFKVIRPPQPTEPNGLPATPFELQTWPTEGAEADSRGEWEGRFLHEALLTAGLEHPGIVPIHEIGRTDGGLPYYTMRLIRGDRTLAVEMAAYQGRSVEARLALLEPFLKLCDTVAYAHEHGLVHRDIKPANIALGPYGEVVLIDWGLAKVIGSEVEHRAAWEEGVNSFRDAAGLETLPSLIGTPGYMAPEAATMDVDRIGVRSDVYSLGTILFQVLTGALPVKPSDDLVAYVTTLIREEAPRATDYDEEIPAELAAICARALERDPASRTAGASILADELRAWQARQARELQARSLLEEARRLADNGAALDGESLLRQCERAQGLLDRALEADGAVPGADLLRTDLDKLRQRAVHEQGRAARRRVLTLAALVFAGVIIAGGVIVGLLLDVERREAIDARDSAERLIEQMLYRLGETVEAAGRIDKVGEITGPITEYYERAPAPRSAADAARRGEALFVLGYVLSEQGYASESREHHERSLRMLEPFAREAGPCDRVQYTLARTQIGTGLACVGDDDPQPARRSFQAAVAIARAVIDAKCDGVGGHKYMVWATYELAQLLARVDPAAALLAYERALAHIEPIQAVPPENEASRHNIPRFEARLRLRIAAMQQRLGSAADAEQNARAAIAILESARALYDKPHGAIENALLHAHRMHALLRATQGSWDDARSSIDAADGVLRAMPVKSAEIPTVLRERMQLRLLEAGVSLRRGNAQAAQRALDLFSKVLKSAPEKALQRYLRGVARALSGGAERPQGLPLPTTTESASERRRRRLHAQELLACAELLEALCAAPGANEAVRALAAQLWTVYGDYREAVGDAEDAAAAHARAKGLEGR